MNHSGNYLNYLGGYKRRELANNKNIVKILALVSMIFILSMVVLMHGCVNNSSNANTSITSNQNIQNTNSVPNMLGEEINNATNPEVNVSNINDAQVDTSLFG